MRSRSARTSAPEVACSARERGFTILEVVITTMLVGVVAVVMTSGLLSVQRSEATVRGRTTSLDELRFTLANVTKDLRQAATVDPTSTASRIEMTTYVDGARASVVWEVNGDGDLQRAVNGGAPTIDQEGVLDPNVFSYLPDATFAEVVFIDLTLKPQAKPDAEITVTGEVRLRNRGTG